MSFKNLEQRFNENVNKLYAGAKTKFADGKPSTGASDDPILVRAPGDNQTGLKTEGRGLPFVSAPRDVKRLTLFQLSPRGIKFLLNQQTLQTGNTFEHTRIINPAFVVGNAVPFLHIKRNLRPVQLPGLLGKLVPIGNTDTSPEGLRKIGQLQQESFDRFRTLNLGGLIKKVLTASPIGKLVSAATTKRSVGDDDDLRKRYTNSRPELMRDVASALLGGLTSTINSALGTSFEPDFGYVVFKQLQSQQYNLGKTITITPKYGHSGAAYKTYLTLTNDKAKWSWTSEILGNTDYLNSKIRPTLEPVGEQGSSATSGDTRTPLLATNTSLQTQFENSTTIQELRTSELERNQYIIDSYFNEVTNGDITTQSFLKYFDSDQESISSLDAGVDQGDGSKTLNAKYIAANRTNKTKRISYIKDPANKKYTNLKADTAYSNLPGMGATPEQKNFDDPVVVSFAMGNKEHIQFRAFITNLQQNASPEYTNLQYIGRIEKFISFKGIQRDISFKLGIIAFSKDELDIVWSRINYLTGMVYPYGFTRGILQPNIIRLTIGNVYVNQPGYITSLGTSFNDLSESWDIDRQVPISATMDVKFVLIEKATKIATSPFYGITEQNTEYFATSLSNPQPPGAVGQVTAIEPAVVPASLGRSLDAGKLQLRTNLPTVNPETLPLPGVKKLNLPAPTIPSFNTNA